MVAGALAPGAARAVTVSPPVRLATCPTDLAADADGGVRLLTRTQARGRWTAAVARFDAAGAAAPGLTLSRSWKRPNAVRTVFTSDGVAVAFETGRPKPPPLGPVTYLPVGTPSAAKTRPRVSVVLATPSGTTAPQVVSDPRREADLHEITSRGGTTVVHFRQSVPGKLWLQDWIAVRPAGASRFLPAVSLQSKLRDKFADDQVYLGPDGSGVVVSLSVSARRQPISVRRIGADGSVGPAIGYPPRRTTYAYATAAIGPRGEVLLAVVDAVKVDGASRDGLFVATLQPGASTFTAPQLLGAERADTEAISDGLAAVIDANGRITATTGRSYRDATDDFDPGFQTYSGTGDQLVRGPYVPAVGGKDPVLTPMADGSVALTWSGYVDLKGQTIAQLVSFRGPDGTWSAPAPISPPFKWDVGYFAVNRGSAALPGGGLAMAYSIERDGRKTRCSLVRVMP